MMGTTKKDLEIGYGPVLITKGALAGRIGDYDDDDTSKTAIVYIGGFGMGGGYHLVRTSYLQYPTLKDLIERRSQIYPYLWQSTAKGSAISETTRLSLFREYYYISEIVTERFIDGEFQRPDKNKKIKIFLSHSSSDKPIVRIIAHDLIALKYRVWFDENEIRGGDSLIEEISKGITDSKYMFVFLSKKAVKSSWVKEEYYKKLMQKISGKKVHVVPILLDDCDIPIMLQDKKYLDFREGHSYSDSFRGLLSTLGHFDNYRETWSKLSVGQISE